jgi:SpoVK/Ycf46/Vps4 family AAA+-type ATPase
LALPKAETEQLRQVAVQAARHKTISGARGVDRKSKPNPGLRALFTGASGTGKTTAAEVIAGELKCVLYRIDLSQVVSKYIGETEKNLRRLFDDAEAGGAILFFDEADALFGKRSEVKDSHDRYANIEVSYLLQRIESYRGLVIFATERKAALDSAFLRRLRYVVNFRPPAPRPAKTPAPERAQRKAPLVRRPQKRRPRAEP